MTASVSKGELPQDLGDFTATRRMLPITLLAIAIGCLSAFVALGLLRMIGLFTNLFFFQRWDTALASPANNQLGPLVVLIPVVGSIVVGLFRLGRVVRLELRAPSS